MNKWYITFSPDGCGEVDGFFCPDCMTKEMMKENMFAMIPAECGIKYECQLCKRDYRDEAVKS